MTSIGKITEKQWAESLSRRSLARFVRFYSSRLGGWSDEVKWMLIPLDDHMVHRGDGVFEALRFDYGAFYDLASHLSRLRRSAHAIELEVPWSDKELTEVCSALVPDVSSRLIIRLFVSRGAGGFSPDPLECQGPSLYAVATEAQLPSAEKYDSGIRAGLSRVPGKPSPFYSIKSCNYLPNVLMKIEARKSGLDLVVGLDEKGFISEGPTENFILINERHELLTPSPDHCLAGTTVSRVMDLARAHRETLGLTKVSYGTLQANDLTRAAAMAFVGTTLSVLPVGEFEGRVLQPHPVLRQLHLLLQEDMKTNSVYRTTVNFG